MSMRLPPWWLDVEAIGETTVVRFVHGAPLNEESGYALGKYLRGVVEAGNCHQIVINLAHVNFLDSMLIGKLFGLHRTLKAVGGRLALCGVNVQLNSLLDVFRLPQIIPIEDSEEDALLVLDSMPIGLAQQVPGSSPNDGISAHAGPKDEQKWREQPASPAPALANCRRRKKSASPA